MSSFSIVDDKYIPLYRVMWVAATPHFCGDEECQREGFYEVRLEQGESVWATMGERDSMIQALDHWQEGVDPPPGAEGDSLSDDGDLW